MLGKSGVDLSEGRGRRFESCRVRQLFQLVTRQFRGRRSGLCSDNSDCSGFFCLGVQNRTSLEFRQLEMDSNGR